MSVSPNRNVRFSKLAGEDSKSNNCVSMRGDDEPTATTHVHNGFATRPRIPSGAAADVLDAEDMSFDLIAQNTVIANGDKHFKD